MKRIKYGVIILNYNSFQDCKIAVESVVRAAVTENYVICIVDGGSTIEGEIARLQELKNEKIYILDQGKNVGYACGNNAGTEFLESMNIDCEYYVIMNPDVEIIQEGTIEGLIWEIENSKKNTVGAQPLVNCNDVRLPSNCQINIRRIMTYSDILVNSSWILKRIFLKKMRAIIYADQMPYDDNIFFEVPSGAFFVIKKESFCDVDRFDSRTFLYCEELLLGYKLKMINKNFVLVPRFYVNHYQGKTTGSHHKIMSQFSYKCTVDSTLIYLESYLCVGKLRKFLYLFVSGISYKIKKILL